MFAVVDLQTTFRVRYLGVFITKIRTKFYDFAIKPKVKELKFALEQTMKAQRRSRDIALLFL
jgi:hypothetical protein